MRLQMFYTWAKKIHNWSLWFVVVLGSWMMLSGYLMHKELEGESILSTDLMLFARFWHDKVSQAFILVFGLQMVTGLLMWVVPKILSRRVQSKLS